MQYFIGCKLIQAQPMTLGEYNDYRCFTIPESEDPAREGYLVMYSDGYESWSPKEAFEKAYLPMGYLDPASEDGMLNYNKITEGIVDAFLGEVTDSQLDEKTTLVTAKTISGFLQHEVSSCVDPANYDHVIGKMQATMKIKNNLWKCLGFVLQWAKYGIKG